MALAVKHNFVSAKADGTDASLLRPSNWNDSHAITLATNNLVGRASAGAGAAEEIPTSAAVIALLASADLATFLVNLGISPPTTGDGRLTLKSTPTATWLMMDDGTFGNAGSGSSNRNNVDCLALFNLLYTFSDAICPVLTSAGGATNRASLGTAAAAWAALARMTLPKQLGRSIVGAGAGAGLTARTLGSSFGGNVTLIAANLPPVTSTNAAQAISVNSTVNVVNGGVIASDPGTGGAGQHPANVSIGVVTSTGNNAISVASTGTSSTPFDASPASTAWNVMVKL